MIPSVLAQPAERRPTVVFATGVTHRRTPHQFRAAGVGRVHRWIDPVDERDAIPARLAAGTIESL